MNNKIVRALVSLLIAFGLWVYVISVVNPESEQTYYNVPVVLNGSNILESRGLMLVSDSDVRLDLKLSGNRTDLNQLSKDNITILADLSGITSAGEHTIRYDISYPGSISSGIKPLNQDSQHITVRVAEWAKKDVPVDVEYLGSLPEDYTADKNVVLDHSKVTVSGPKDVIDRICEASISLDLTDRTQDFTQVSEITFLDEKGHPVTELSHVTTNATHITATLKVSMLKTLDIVVKVIPGGGMQAEDVTISTDLTQLMVSGPADKLRDLNEIVLTIDLSKVDASQTMKFDIELPNGVTNITGIPHVNVDVVIPETTTRTFFVYESQYVSINVPENMQITFITRQFDIQIRGREDLLAKLKSENIRVIIDFANAVEGKSEYAVTFEIVGVDGVGVTVERTVWAEVTLIDSDPSVEPEG